MSAGARAATRAAIGLLAAVLSGCGGDASDPSGRPAVSSATVPQGTRTYTVPSSAVEPTLHCARPAPGCEARHADEVEVATPADKISRGDVAVFRAPRPRRSDAERAASSSNA
jgi:hypothetical protein